MPQAFKNVLPALCNEFVVLLKETSVAGYVAVQDLTKGGDIIRSRTYDAWTPLLIVAAVADDDLQPLCTESGKEPEKE